MLQAVLARNNLLCGFDDGIDPSRETGESSDWNSHGSGANVFFGPHRDALHLISRRHHSMILLRPKLPEDLKPQAILLALPGSPADVRQELKALLAPSNLQKTPTAHYAMMCARATLQSDADVFEQEFQILAEGQPIPAALQQLAVHVSSFIDHNCLRQRWSLQGISRDRFDIWFLHWHQPEIAASQVLQSTAYLPERSALVSWRGDVFFGIAGFCGDQVSEPAPVAFAECGWQQLGRRSLQRIDELLDSLTQTPKILGFDFIHTQNLRPMRKAWIGLEPRSLHAIGTTDGLINWFWPESSEAFELNFQIAKSIDELSDTRLKAFPTALASSIQEDQQWLARQRQAPAYLPQRVRALYQRTLLTMRQMQDPDGGIIAAPEFHFEFTHCGGYGFCWGRDAGFISFAMDVCGMHAESAKFYRYMAQCQSRDGSFLHRHDMAGKLASSWGFLQPDETGSVLFGLCKHLELSQNRDLMVELRDMIQRAANWLVSARHPRDPELPIAGHDLWEEREGVHFYSVAAMAAGIKSAIKIYEIMNWPVAKAWQDRASALQALLHSDLFYHQEEGEHRRFMARSLRRKVSDEERQALEAEAVEVTTHISSDGRLEHFLKRDFVVDIAQLGGGFPYEVFDIDADGEHWDHLLNQIEVRLWRPGVGGIGRYEGDHYRQGNPWILATLWLALAANQRRNYEISKRCWSWTIQHASASGLFAEQIDPHTGKPSWVMPLTWSHAMFALSVHFLSEEVVS